jgi:chorismate dehydratase
VFAAWVSNKPLSPAFIQSFNEANALGLMNLEKVIASIDNPTGIDLKHYYTQNIQYRLDEAKRKALKKFLQWSQSFNAEPLFERS